MPQTEEHLAILELLGVPRGIPVLTKRDLVDAEWLELVRADVAARLARSRVRWDPPLAASAVSGQGVEDVRAALRRLAADLPERPADDLFRLPIDRVFAVAGAGTVVTGSTWSGTVAVGDTVRLLPLERAARVRSIEVHGQSAERAVPGRRTALALVGVDKAELARGHVALTGAGWRASTALDVEIELLPAARKPLVSRTRVRVHLGTAEALARAVQTQAIAPGARGPARLLLERPLVARGGDRFVLRSFSPVTTIGGGVVLDPFPPARSKRRRRALGADQPPEERLAGLAAEAGLGGLPVESLPVRLGIRPGAVTAVIAAAGAAVLRLGDWVVATEAVAAAGRRAVEVLRRHHDAHPLDPGMSLQALRAAMATGATGAAGAAPAAVLDAVLERVAREGALEIAGGVARLAGWRPSLDARAREARERLARRLVDAGWQVPTVAELEHEFPGAPVRALLAHLAREGTAEAIDADRYAAPAALAGFRAALEAALHDLGPATPAALRDRLGLTRKYLIPLLEWADRRGVTRRTGDVRVLARLTVGKGES
jgi:selenocysteine-specific elongation factor